MLEGLLCCGPGRNASFTDRPLIQKTLNELGGEDFPVRELIKRVVSSRQFKSRYLLNVDLSAKSHRISK
jgi:hypothetical protein